MSFTSMHNDYLEQGNPMLEDDPPCEYCKHDLNGECELEKCVYEEDKEMNRAEILDAVKKTICEDRQDIHGSPEQTHSIIADYWNTYLMSNNGISHAITAQDVAIMMCLFKIARFGMNSGHTDNLHDLIGYAAIAAELQFKKLAPQT